ncbi:MAG: threonine synthase [Acidobacteria bacterium RIFCSPLOWO2_02_FULL_64_15]|nr:MAG: threonine synthase [Acidobacteria bacterium RIFCSPLOWO2_02_FULL_64_15]
MSLAAAIFDGLAPDGGLYVPESIARWSPGELAELPSLSLPEVGFRVLRPFVGDELDPAALRAVLVDALDFPIPLVEVEPGVHALELFHGPTLAFKDIGARVMARLMAALWVGDEPLTVLVATSGDTGSAVAHAFHAVPHTRVVVLYPDGRVSPTQEAQLTMFNGEAGNVRAYAVAGSFDDCQRLAKAGFADPELARHMTSANSINIGRLLPQMIYYAHAVARMRTSRTWGPASAGPTGSDVTFSTPSGNFGNLTAGLMMKRAGLPIGRFVAATNANDVVPAYLATGRFEPRASVHTLSNAMDVGNPSNFERLMWLYAGDLEALKRDLVGSRHDDDEVRATIRRIYDERGYLLDPHSAVAYLGLKSFLQSDAHLKADVVSGFSRAVTRSAGPAVFLATAHPAKFGEIVEPIIGRPVLKPQPLGDALSRPRRILRIDGTLEAVKDAVTR